MEQRIYSALERAELNEESIENLMAAIRCTDGNQEIAFDEFLILWHVATDLCYADEHDAYDHGYDKTSIQ